MTDTIMKSYAAFVANLAKPRTNEIEEHIHGVVGITKELGELTDNIYRCWNYGKALDRENIVEECGDILFYMQIILNQLNVKLDTVVMENMRKLDKRYPSGIYSDVAALARADKDIKINDSSVNHYKEWIDPPQKSPHKEWIDLDDNYKEYMAEKDKEDKT